MSEEFLNYRAGKQEYRTVENSAVTMSWACSNILRCAQWRRWMLSDEEKESFKRAKLTCTFNCGISNPTAIQPQAPSRIFEVHSQHSLLKIP